MQRQRNRERSILGGLAALTRRVSLSSNVIVSGANNSASEMPSGPHNAARVSTVGFVTPDGNVWGRPVGVAVAKDGALMVTDDGSGTVWRVTYTGKK